jgi:hypothetical protein
MGRIIQKNNGKTSILTTGENISNITPEVGTYFIGPDLVTGDYTILNPEGEVFNLEANYMTGGTYDSTGGTLTISGPNYNISISGFSTGGGGTFDVIDVTYSELYNLIVNGLLTVGSWYRLTDYQCVNFLNGGFNAYQYAQGSIVPVDVNYNPLDVHIGNTEVLLLQAITTSELSPIAYSESNQQDIITYEAYTNVLGVRVEAYNGFTLPDTSVVAGFDILWDSVNNYAYFNMPANYPAYFGNLFYVYAEFSDGLNDYYQDGVFEPLVPNISKPQYDYSIDYGLIMKPMSRLSVVDNGTKIILLDLTQDDVTNYILDSLYVEFVRPITNAKGFITRRIDTTRKIDVPFDFRSVTYRRFEANFSLNQNSNYMGVEYNLFMDSYNFGGYISTISTTGNYKDVLSLSPVDTTQFTVNCAGGPYAGWYRGYYDNVVTDYVFDAELTNTVNATINNMQYSKIDGYVYNSIISNIYYTKIKGSVYYCLFDYSNNNVFNVQQMSASKFRGNHQNNQLNINYMYGWDAGEGFQTNNFTANSVQWFKTSDSGFKQTNLLGDLNSQDFTFASIVYGSYSKNIFSNANNQPRLSYVNGSDVLTITTVTS